MAGSVAILTEQDIAVVRERVSERDKRWRQRKARAAEIPDGVFMERIGVIRARIAADLQTPEHQRTSAFRPLAEDELALLERQTIVRVVNERLIVLESQSERINELLSILRINLAVGRTVVSCEQFRIFGRACMQHQWMGLERCFARWNYSLQLVMSSVLVLPWRAGLLYGEVFHRSECTSLLWHIGARRNERTLAAEIYHESAPPPEFRDRVHLVCDPMLATGGTQATTIERLIAAGVAPDRIVAVAIVAAPEGVDFLLSRYPHLRIVTCALDECLDARGYITGPGLGDFGDLAYGDLDEEYVARHWVAPGLLTHSQAALILERMARARTNGDARAAT